MKQPVLFKSITITFVFFLLCFPVKTFAQKIVADVNVVLEKLPIEKREKLTDFQQEVTEYINQYDYCENQYNVELPIKVQIYLQDASVSYEDRYTGRLLISNKSDMQFFDKRWRFNYDGMEPLIHDESQYHPLTSVIDFYIYIILGGEFDKYGKFEGTPFYEKALKISQQANFSKFILGWEERKEIIHQIMAEKNKAYREALDTYFLGISYAQEDYNVTLEYCKKAIDLLAQLIQENSEYELPKQFIDGHRLEIINIFKETENYQNVFQTLIQIDPDHKEDYKKYL